MLSMTFTALKSSRACESKYFVAPGPHLGVQSALGNLAVIASHNLHSDQLLALTLPLLM